MVTVEQLTLSFKITLQKAVSDTEAMSVFVTSEILFLRYIFHFIFHRLNILMLSSWLKPDMYCNMREDKDIHRTL